MNRPDPAPIPPNPPLQRSIPPSPPAPRPTRRLGPPPPHDSIPLTPPLPTPSGPQAQPPRSHRPEFHFVSPPDPESSEISTGPPPGAPLLPPDRLDSASSVFEKTDADFRRRLDRAIVDRDPPTYRAVYGKFDLARREISYAAFYRYARRLRLHAAAVDLVHAVRPDDPDPADLVPALLAQRLLDAAQDESASPRTLLRLAEAWRLAASARRLDAELRRPSPRPPRNDLDELTSIVRAYGRIVRADPGPP